VAIVALAAAIARVALRYECGLFRRRPHGGAGCAGWSPGRPAPRGPAGSIS